MDSPATPPARRSAQQPTTPPHLPFASRTPDWRSLHAAEQCPPPTRQGEPLKRRSAASLHPTMNDATACPQPQSMSGQSCQEIDPITLAPISLEIAIRRD